MAPATATCEDLVVETRPGEPGDHRFVYATWLRSYRHSSKFARRIRDEVFFASHHELVHRLFLRGARLTVAHPAGDPGTIVGYAVTERLLRGIRIAGLEVEGPVLHWLYVKGPFRRIGVAKLLLQAEAVGPNCTFTHLTADGERLWESHPEATYWPHLAF